jgi:hypothetical protein
VHRKLSALQEHLLDGVYREGAKRISEAYKREKASKKERIGCKKVADSIRSEGVVRIAINLSLRQRIHRISLAESLFTGGRLLNDFEITTATGDTQSFATRQRLLTELIIYGGTRDQITGVALLPDDEHPIYGILDYTGNPVHTRGSQYGAYRLILKEHFFERSTFIPYDSYAAQSRDVYCWGHIEGVLASRPGALDPCKWYEYVRNKQTSSHLPTLPAYIEAQVLGPVYLSEVEKIFFPYADTLDPWFMSVLEAIATKYTLEITPY